MEAAVEATAAVKILGAESFSHAGKAMRSLVRRKSSTGQLPGFTWKLEKSATLAAVQIKAYLPNLGPAYQLRYRAVLPKPSAADRDQEDVEHIARSVPSMMWPTLAMHMGISGPLDYSKRQALMCGLVVVGSDLRISDAARLLGGTISGGTAMAQLYELGRGRHWMAITTALVRLADYLHSHCAPIDYERRRRLEYDDLLPECDWRRICRATGAFPEAAHRAAISLRPSAGCRRGKRLTSKVPSNMGNLGNK